MTCNWIHTLATNYPSGVVPYVLCESTSNETKFGLPGIHVALPPGTLDGLRYKWIRRLSLGASPFPTEFGSTVVRKTGSDLLHSHFGFRGWDDLGLARECRLPHVVSFYGADACRLPSHDVRWRMRYKYLFERATLLLCEGPRMASRLIELGCPQSKIRIHHLAVNTTEIEFRPRSWQPGSPLNILIVGTFTEKKGIPFALEAAARLARQVDVRVSVIGDANSTREQQKEKQHILDTVKRLNFSPQVTFHGYKDRAFLLDEAYRHHLLICASITAKDGDAEGGAPVVLLDMAATGMPIVSTNHCDIPEIIEPQTGLLAAERDVNGIVVRLEELLSHPENWAALAARLRRHVEEQFDSAQQGRRLMNIYEEAISLASKGC